MNQYGGKKLPSQSTEAHRAAFELQDSSTERLSILGSEVKALVSAGADRAINHTSTNGSSK